jgi:hypothetical protein
MGVEDFYDSTPLPDGGEENRLKFKSASALASDMPMT